MASAMAASSTDERMEDTEQGAVELEHFDEKMTDGEKVENSFQEEMDPDLWSTLREELVEKVIARLPLKALVQSQALSRKWRSLFLSTPFQTEVSSVSSRWGSYYPLYVSDKELMGFDRSTHRWQPLFSLPEFPEDFCRGFTGPSAWTLSLCGVTGSLIILSYYRNHTLHVFVTNPINKSVRRLPPLDLTDDAPLDPRVPEWDDNVLVLPASHYSYKVLVFTRNMAANVLQVRVYHSELNSWKEPQRGPVLPGAYLGLDSGCYLGKIFYLAFLKSIDETPCTLRSWLEDLMFFYAYDAEKGVLEQIVLPSPQQVPDVPIRVCKLVVAGSDLMLVVGQGSGDQDEEQRLESLRGQVSTGMEVEDNEQELGSFSQEYLHIPKESFLLFKLDPKSLQLREISRGPAEKLSSRTFTGFVLSDKDCIYLQTESTVGENEFGVVAYDLRQQVWSCLPLDSSLSPCFDVENTTWTDFAFQPGLHPFAMA